MASEYPKQVVVGSDVVFIEIEPGVFLSPTKYATEPIVVSDEFRRYAELSQASLDVGQYLAVALRQFWEMIK